MNLIEFLAENKINPNGDICDILKSAEGLKKYQCSESSPIKPILPKNPTSADYANMAETMKEYEEKLVGWKETESKNKLHNIKIDTMICDFIKEESGLNELKFSDKVKNQIFSHAWSSGHSDGYIQVYYHLLELVEMLKD